MIARLLATTPATGALAALSPREGGVVTQMAEGRSNAAIALRLVITERRRQARPAIFLELGLQPSDDCRRVLAVLAYLGR